LKTVDWGLAAVSLIVPLAFGGNHHFGRLLLVTITCAVAIAWFTRQAFTHADRARSVPGLWLFGLATLVVGLQLVQLPTSWIASLSPRISELLPMWSPGGLNGIGLGKWQTLSLAPDSSRIALVMMLTYGLLFTVASQRLVELGDLRKRLYWLAGGAALAASIGLLQKFGSNGLFLWFYERPGFLDDFDLRGTFGNRNHLGHFLVLALGPLLALTIAHLLDREASKTKPTSFQPQTLQKTLSDIGWQTFVLGGATLLVAFTALLTLSRGAMITVAFVSCLTLLACWVRGLLTSRTVGTLGGFALGIFALLTVYGYEKVAHRLDDLTVTSLEQLDKDGGRRSIWAANVGAIKQGGWFGSGTGSHSRIYHAYLKKSQRDLYVYAENGYLQVLTENGFLGGFLLVLALAVGLRWAFVAIYFAPSNQSYLLAVGVVASLAASLLQSTWDFVWYNPACFAATLFLLAVLARLAAEGSPRRSAYDKAPLDSFRWVTPIGVTALGAALVFSMIGPGIGALHWDSYLLASRARERLSHARLAKPHSEYDPESERAELTEKSVLYERMLTHLRAAVRWHPGNADAHLMLATRAKTAFMLESMKAQNAMPVLEIRDAALGRFASPQELKEWLVVAFGEHSQMLYEANHHAQRAATLSPLLGKAYLHLADLCFLRTDRPDVIDACVAQALLTQPQSGDVLFSAGQQKLVQGETAKAFEFWQDAFQDEGIHQQRIIQLLAAQLPAPAFLEMFQPKWDTLRPLWTHYRASARTAEELIAITEYAVAQAKREMPSLSREAAGSLWLRLATMQIETHQAEAALQSLATAVRVTPENYGTRRLLGLTLAEAGRIEEAETHLDWCLIRRPRDESVKQTIQAISKARLAALRSENRETSLTPTSF
ncbi:MAG: O-antigen ligase family protein, partial [Lacipirellulaceae bacterium]